MEKQGYKQTEVGSIPEDWNVYRFEDLGDTIIGLTYKPVDVNITGKLVHRSSNIQNNKLAYHDNVYVTCHVPEKLILRKNDILICVRNGSRDLIGKSAIIQGISIGETFGAFMSVFRPRIYPPLVYQYFISNIVQSQINASLGATINQITNKTLNSFITVFPTNLKEQKAIANALSDVDELITNLDKLITKKKAIKQGAMQQLLTPPHKGGKRLDGFSGEWVEQHLNDLCWYQEGPGLRKWQFTDKGIKVINITNLVDGYLNLEKTTRHISWDEFNKMYQHFEIDEGDILVASSGNSYCKTSVVRKHDLPLVMNTSVIRFKPNNKMDYNLLLIFLKSNLFKDQIDLLITGGAQPNFGPAHLKKIKLILPPSIKEQSAIAKILSDIDLEIEQLESKKTKYQSIKQGMMQELLTGKTRLV